MPKYHYQCEECAHGYEAWHSFDDDPPACPACKSDQVKKVPAFFVFKKGGFSEKYTSKPGELTVEAIEENRQSLKEMKKEARKEL